MKINIMNLWIFNECVTIFVKKDNIVNI